VADLIVRLRLPISRSVWSARSLLPFLAAQGEAESGSKLRALQTLRATRAPSAWQSRMTDSGYTALVKQAGGWWIGSVQEIPGVNVQERTKEELLVSLREALRETLEFNRDEAPRAAKPDYAEEPLAL